MTFYAIKLFLGSCLSFVQKHWRAAVIALTAIALLVGVIWAWFAYVAHEQQKVANGLNNDNQQIFQGSVNSGIVEGEKNKRENEVKDAEKQTEPALENVNRAKSVDSGSLSDDERAARERFCQSYPSDSRCVKR